MIGVDDIDAGRGVGDFLIVVGERIERQRGDRRRGQVARIDVGAQVVARNAVEALRGEDVLGGHLLRLVDPAPDFRLGFPQVACEGAVGPCSITASEQGFMTGESFGHEV